MWEQPTKSPPNQVFSDVATASANITAKDRNIKLKTIAKRADVATNTQKPTAVLQLVGYIGNTTLKLSLKRALMMRAFTIQK